MSFIYSNASAKDLVLNPFLKMIGQSTRLYLAAPYFTQAEPILEALRDGKPVQLLVGLNEATSPNALKTLHGLAGISIRYLTDRFHAKIYVFDQEALLGSSNLTDGGLVRNREAVIKLSSERDPDAFEDVRALFLELWEAGEVLTAQKLSAFAAAHQSLMQRSPNAKKEIETAVGKAEPPSIDVASKKKPKERIFLQTLRREVYEQYRPAFNEVSSALEENNLRREDLAGVGLANEANRFLNYVRLTHAIGEESWQSAPVRTPEERRLEILKYGVEWKGATNNKVPDDYADWLNNVETAFGTPEEIAGATKEQIIEGLMSLHAFIEQLRFVKGGAKNLPTEFWVKNNNDVERVKRTLTYFLHGPGDFIERFHDVLYHPFYKLARFGYFCGLELYGTVKPDECPPMNGRMAKALRFLGFDVKGG